MLPENDSSYVYILKCIDHSYYTGWTTNLKKRYLAHCKGKGARYTKAHPPIACVYYEECASKVEAMQREYEIKQYPRHKKQALIAAWQDTER